MSEHTPLGERWLNRAITHLPRHGLTRLGGVLAGTTVPRPMRAPVYRAFAAAVGANVAEQELPFSEYPNLSEYFCRRLKHGVRVWRGSDEVLASPCDGTLASLGTISGDRLPQVKGQSYSLSRFLGGEQYAERYRGGMQATIYLSPSDYHRVHAPFGGRVTGVRRIGGDLFPVKPSFIATRPDVFVENERIVFEIQSETTGLRSSVVMVGATIVGSVKTELREGALVAGGAELGAFMLGSTAVVLLEPEWADIEVDARVGGAVRLGQVLGKQ